MERPSKFAKNIYVQGKDRQRRRKQKKDNKNATRKTSYKSAQQHLRDLKEIIQKKDQQNTQTDKNWRSSKEIVREDLKRRNIKEIGNEQKYNGEKRNEAFDMVW